MNSVPKQHRICPGKDLAMNSLFIAMALSTAIFDISKAKDEDGNALDPVCDYTSDIVR